MYVCLCKAVTEDHIHDAIHQGARNAEDIRKACQAGADCGTCRFKVNKILKSALGHEDANSDEQKAV